MTRSEKRKHTSNKQPIEMLGAKGKLSNNSIKTTKPLEVQVEQPKRHRRIQILDGIDEPELAEHRGGRVRSLNPESGSKVEGRSLNDSDAVRILLLIWQQQWFEETRKP